MERGGKPVVDLPHRRQCCPGGADEAWVSVSDKLRADLSSPHDVVDDTLLQSQV